MAQLSKGFWYPRTFKQVLFIINAISTYKKTKRNKKVNESKYKRKNEESKKIKNKKLFIFSFFGGGFQFHLINITNKKTNKTNKQWLSFFWVRFFVSPLTLADDGWRRRSAKTLRKWHCRDRDPPGKLTCYLLCGPLWSPIHDFP